MANSKSGLRKPIFTKIILQKGRANGPQIRQMSIAECLIRDETRMIIFTARNDQDHLVGLYESILSIFSISSIRLDVVLFGKVLICIFY
ncbi:hypothetical protein K2173_017252 [Erythroxylum novogranatense]|uniref:Single-stranded DNA binding protein Ssb-like OB fold domain-containing protein n=1 Tax=Erythroxylum novogranatense TaxID=1862640 RepID=A0AAV8U650_9ROSI|nr:hypothetical protein K2173_017252 [Erythroxylum novogranatense]